MECASKTLHIYTRVHLFLHMHFRPASGKHDSFSRAIVFARHHIKAEAADHGTASCPWLENRSNLQSYYHLRTKEIPGSAVLAESLAVRSERQIYKLPGSTLSAQRIALLCVCTQSQTAILRISLGPSLQTVKWRPILVISDPSAPAAGFEVWEACKPRMSHSTIFVCLCYSVQAGARQDLSPDLLVHNAKPKQYIDQS